MIDLSGIKRDVNLIEFARRRGLKVTDTGKGSCPFHPPDNNSSFSYFRGEDGFWHWKDFHDDSGGTIVDFVARLDNLDDAGACRKLLEEFGEPKIKSPAKKERPAAWNRPVPGETLEAEYVYTDEQGAPLYVKRRFRPKDFDFHHVVDGKKVWDIKGVRRVLFHLPGVVKHGGVWLVEGEKDVLALESLGFIATTAGGANDWRDEFVHFFAGKEAVVCWDTDASKIGRERALAISKVAASVLLIDLEKQAGLTGKADISSFIEGLGDRPRDEKAKAVLALTLGAEKIQPMAAAGSITRFTVPSLLPDAVQAIESGRRGACRGLSMKDFPRLTRALDGLREIVVIVAVPKAGKTTVVLQMGSNVADTGAAVIYYDFENGPLSLLAREFCRKYRVDYWEELFNKDSRWEPILEKLNLFQADRKNLAFVSDRKLTLDTIRTQIREMRAVTNQEKVLIVVDSLQKLPMRLDERRAGVDTWLGGFEELNSQDPNLTILLVSELSREGLPKESSGIEYAAHFLLRLRNGEKGDEPRRLYLEYARDVQASREVGTYECDFRYWEFKETTF
jgi:KaiC/GvpD/RAD55 family RecA-like ATPase